MFDVVTTREAVLEVAFPDGSRRSVRVTESPFVIGCGCEIGNHLLGNDFSLELWEDASESAQNGLC